MQCSNGNIYKKPKRARKRHNEQPKAFACLGFVDRSDLKNKKEKQKVTNDRCKHGPKTKTSNKKQQRVLLIPMFIHLFQLWAYGRLTSRAMKSQKEQQKATKSTFDTHVHSFVPTLGLWKVVDIKSNEKPERATKRNKEHF